MARLSDKTIVQRQFGTGKSLTADFNLPEIEATIRDKSYDCIVEKCLLCPCKGSVTSSPLSTCRSCGGSSYIFVNPTRTRLIISGLAADAKLKEAALREWGLVEGGSVKITALNDDKLTYMDRITVLDATAEHNQIIYPKLSDDETSLFAFTQYNIVGFDFIGLYIDEDTRLQRLIETTDYSFQNNIITFASQYNDLQNASVTVRYIHRPVFHIIDVLRESMTSTKGQYGNQTKLIMPIHAIARRAHLIKDAENFDGDRLLDNSWLPSECETEDLTVFQRQLKYTDVQTIYDNLTQEQKDALEVLLS